MKKIFCSALVLVTILAFSACKKKDTTPPNTAKVMFVNGCAGTSNLDVTANGTKIGGASNLPFLRNSGYQPVTAGSNIAIAVALTAMGTPLTNGTGTLAVNSSYSVFTGGIITAPSFLFVNDDLAAPTTGKAKVRFVNLSSDFLNTSCYVGTIKLDSNIGYNTCTPFYEVMPTTAKVSVIDQVVLAKSGDIPNQVLSAGKIYTFVLTGTSAGTLTSALTLTVINNN